MGKVEEALSPISGYLSTIARDTVNGWYYLEIGLPNSWVFNESNDVSCEIIREVEEGKLIKVAPKNEKVTLDDLIIFVEFIVETNFQIAEKEKQFSAEMENMKKMLEEKATKFYEELDDIKKHSFKKFGVEEKPKRQYNRKNTPVVQENNPTTTDTIDQTQ